MSDLPPYQFASEPAGHWNAAEAFEARYSRIVRSPGERLLGESSAGLINGGEITFSHIHGGLFGQEQKLF
jgi:hypothetical protein